MAPDYTWWYEYFVAFHTFQAVMPLKATKEAVRITTRQLWPINLLTLRVSKTSEGKENTENSCSAMTSSKQLQPCRCPLDLRCLVAQPTGQSCLQWYDLCSSTRAGEHQCLSLRQVSAALCGSLVGTLLRKHEQLFRNRLSPKPLIMSFSLSPQ